MAYNTYHILTIFSSFIFHLAIFKWFSRWILRNVSPVYATLPPDKKIVLRNCVMSGVHGAVAGGLGLYTYLYPGGALPDNIQYDLPILRHNVCIIMGYAAADSLLMVLNPALQDRGMFAHHVLISCASYAGSVTPCVPYYGNLWAVMELSSPFVKTRTILYMMGEKTSLLYKVNGILMLVVFFGCRVAPIPLWFQLAEPLATGELYEVGPLLFIAIVALTPIMYGVNIYWFSKMCMGANRLLSTTHRWIEKPSTNHQHEL